MRQSLRFPLLFVYGRVDGVEVFTAKHWPSPCCCTITTTARYCAVSLIVQKFEVLNFQDITHYLLVWKCEWGTLKAFEWLDGGWEYTYWGECENRDMRLVSDVGLWNRWVFWQCVYSILFESFDVSLCFVIRYEQSAWGKSCFPEQMRHYLHWVYYRYELYLRLCGTHCVIEVELMWVSEWKTHRVFGIDFVWEFERHIVFSDRDLWMWTRVVVCYSEREEVLFFTQNETLFVLLAKHISNRRVGVQKGLISHVEAYCKMGSFYNDACYV